MQLLVSVNCGIASDRCEMASIDDDFDYVSIITSRSGITSSSHKEPE